MQTYNVLQICVFQVIHYHVDMRILSTAVCIEVIH